MLGFYMGLRRSEIGQIKVSDIQLKTGFIKIIGKGNKQRELPIPNSLLPYLNNWLSLRNQQAIEHRLTGKHLLGQVSRHAHTPKLVSLDGLTGEMIRLRLKALWQQMDTSLEQAVPTPHDMRRTAITRWLTKSSPRSAQALAGHSHIQTTMNYSRADLEDEMRKTIEP
jgi:integrase